MSLFEVKLTAEEAMLLAPVERPEVAAMVRRARDTLALSSSGLPEREAAMVAKIVATARTQGRLTCIATPIDSCPCCGRRDGYHVYPRAGRYHRKGAPNYSRPKTFTGYDLARGFVTVQNHISAGYCIECKPRIEPVLLPLLKDVEAELPASWTGFPRRFRRYDNRKCTACGWEGHEGQMLPRRTMFGDGNYPGGCPNCPAENLPLGRTVIELTKGFTVVEVAPPKAAA